MAAWLVAVMVAVAVVLSAAAVRAKECTNIPTQLSSHTVRARLQSTPGAAEWRWRELFHDHLNPTDDAAWMDLMPPPPRGGQQLGAAVGEELDWAMLYRSLKGQQPLLPGAGAAAAAGPFLEEVSLHDVRLDLDGDAAYGRAQRTNLEYLLLLDVDRLVWSFRTQAGLPAPGEPYGGWEGKDVELRGHFVGTHTFAASPLRRHPARTCRHAPPPPPLLSSRRVPHVLRSVPGRIRPITALAIAWCSGSQMSAGRGGDRHDRAACVWL